MQVELKPGKYVVAVSGGVDSMVLLDKLRQLPKLSLVVVHVDHGMRPDSGADQILVAEQAAAYELPFFTISLSLGAGASEATARKARYQFLETVKAEQAAQAVVTAHHQDDAIETAIINLVRGTGRRGLTALANTADRRRPLLDVPKSDIIEYAKQQQLVWREDSTNSDDRYLRNYIRHQVVPKFSTAERSQFVLHITKLRELNELLDASLQEMVKILAINNEIDRRTLQELPSNFAKELLTSWWRSQGFNNYETKTIIRAYQALCRGQSGAITPLKKPFSMTIGRTKLALHNHER